MPTPSDQEGNDPLDRFLGLRDSLRTARSGHGGSEVCEALTIALDGAIAEIVDPLPVDVAVVALGGYGRRELSPHSDVDLMLLHSDDDPSDLAASLFRPLWDAKLRVGHAVRTVKEASSAAKERFDTHTTLLTSRLVAGDQVQFDRLIAEVTAVTKARPLRRHLVSEERERRRLTPYMVMESDVKTGRGGLRTLQGFEWEQRREELIGRFSSVSTGAEDEAREVLIRVRNALHAVTGRSHDVFSTDLREPVARWLDLDVFETAQMLVDAMQTVDALATRRWHEVIDEKPRRVWARLAGKPPPLSGTIEPSVEGFLWALESGEQGRLAFERLWDERLLDAVLPEWGVVRSLPQLAPFHEHPLASHLWRTVDEMHQVIEEDSHYGQVAGEIDDRATLLFAAFLHDIGKGHGGDHASVGAGIARAFCGRLDIDAGRSNLLEDAVRHHLLLATTATRRDLDDPAVIDEVADTVGSLRLLRILYLLTVADSRATGATMWSDWKATLLRTLFVRCAASFGPDREETGTTPAAVLATASPGRTQAVEDHINGMPPEYLRSSTDKDVLWHLQLINEMDGVSNLGVRPASPVESAVVVGHGRPGFRRRVAEVFAANGIDVLEARLLSRADGVVVDSFRVIDDRTGGRIDRDKWDGVRHDLEAGLLGQLDTGSKVAARAAAYDESRGEKPVVRGVVDSATGDLVMTIECADRIGRLAEILSVLNDCGLGIRLAKIDSRAGEVIDTFHVDGDGWQKERGDVDALAHRVASGLSVRL